MRNSGVTVLPTSTVRAGARIAHGHLVWVPAADSDGWSPASEQPLGSEDHPMPESLPDALPITSATSTITLSSVVGFVDQRPRLRGFLG